MNFLSENVLADIRNKVGPFRTLMDITKVILEDPEHKCPDVLVNILRDALKESEKSMDYLTK